METNKKLHVVILSVMTLLLVMVGSTSAALIDITSDTLTHFANFTNDSPAGSLSRISASTPATSYGDFGWHNSPSSDPGFPQYAGILLNNSYSVIGLRFQVHRNPFQNFTLQGSNNTTTGSDGTWADVFSGKVTNRDELNWQEWSFTNSSSHSAYRIHILNDYAGGWAMYRWDLMAEPNPVPIPPTVWLLGAGLVGIIGLKRKLKR